MKVKKNQFFTANFFKRFLFKPTILLLVFLFIFQPIAPVFAQQADPISNQTEFLAPSLATDSIPIDNLAPTDKTNPADTANPQNSQLSNPQNFPITSDSVNAAIFSAATKSSSKEPAESSSLMSPATQGVTSSTSGLAISQNQYKLQPKVDSESGAMIFSYPIEVPFGTNGLQPNLALSYNSQNADEGSIFGYGWTLSGMPEISRVNKSGIDQLYTNESSQWSLSSNFSGELVSVGSNIFKAKSDDGTFLKYTYDPASQSFTAKDKNGTTYIFGVNNSSRQIDPFNSANIYKWMISSITDANGNAVTFYYNTGSGQISPSVINYGPYQIYFVMNNRNDVITNYKPGFYSFTYDIISEIQVKFNGSIQKKYTINYKTGDNGKRSLLSSIQVSGYDQQGNLTTEPATAFNYSVSSAPNWVQSQNVTLPPNTNLTDGSSIAADINGDGYTDILTAYQDSSGAIYKYAYLNKGDSTWALSSAYIPPDFFISKLTGLSYGWTAFDINGDRLLDLVQSYKTDPNSQVRNTYLNTGSGWNLDNTLGYNLPATLIWNNSYGYMPNVATVADLNGDGLMDISVYSGYRQYGLNVGTFLNNSGSTNGFRFATDPWNTSPNSVDTKVNYTDINADGIDDLIIDSWVYNNGNCTEYSGGYIGDGIGHWWQYTNPPIFNHSPHSYCYLNAGININLDYGGRVFDINSDGLPDLVYSTTSANGYSDHFTYLNTGSGWTANQPNFVLPQSIQFSSSEGKTIGGFIDLNGDGISELYSNNTVYVNQNAKYADVLNSITYPTGGTVAVTYKPSTQYKDASGNLLNPKLPIIVQTVNTIITSDPVNNISNTDTYSYANGFFFYDQYHLRDKKFVGFGKVSKTDSVGNVVVSYFHTGARANAAYGAYSDYYAQKAGRMYRQEVYGPDGKIYTADIYKWDILYGTSSFVFLAQQIHQDIDGQSGHKDKAISYTYDNSNGNLLTKTNYGRILGYDDGNFGDVGADGTYSGPNDDIITTYTYATDEAYKYKVSGETLTDAGSNKLRETKYYYDNLPFGQISNGNQTKEENWQSGENYINVQKVYNSYGLVAQITDPNGKATNYVYDSYNIYPATVTNALNQTAQFIYNYANGKATQITDANGNIFKNTFDGFGRILKTEQPDQTNPASLVQKTSYIYTDAPGAVSIQQTDYLDSANFVTAYNYYDGLGRIIQTKKSAEAGNFETKDFIYDNRGNLQKESLPYFSPLETRSLTGQASQLYTNYTYDALNRKTNIANAVGATSFVFNNWQTTITDANGNKKDFIYDAYNNLIQVNEYNAGNIYTTVYTYDLAGNLLKITDALGNVRNFVYDGLGRRKSAEDLHNSADSVFGVWNYVYDNAGNLISLTDPKNQTINYVYDALNRKISEDYAGKTGVEITFSFDNCLNGKGRLCKTVSANQIERYEYSAIGNITKDSKTIDDKNFIIQYGFDRQGNQILITNSDNSQTKYDFNSAGLIEKLWRKESVDTTLKTVVNNFDYSPTEQITNIVYANGTQTTNTYDANQLYRLTRKLSTANNVNLQDISYQYDNVGNIKQTTDNSATDAKKTVAYTYDGLYRLLSSTVTNVALGQQDYTQNFSYDALGNILTQTKNSETTNYDYRGNLNNAGSDFANPDAVTKTVTTGTKPVPVISYFTSSPAIITLGKSAVLSWAVSGGTLTSLDIDPSAGSGQATVGSVLGLNFKIVNPTATNTYILTATNSNGSTTKSITITVAKQTAITAPKVLGNIIPTQPAQAPDSYISAAARAPKYPVINFFASSPSSIDKGKSSTLLWSLSGGAPTSLSIDNGVGSVLKKISKVVTPTSTTKYTITAKNKYGTATKSVTVTVNPPAPVISTFSANPTTITQGQSTTLSWTLSGGVPTTLSINNGVGSVLKKTSKIVTPTATTTYTLTAMNVSGTATKPVTITVNPLPPVAPVISTFTATPATIISGQSSTLSWVLSGGAATTLSIDNSVGSVLGASSKTVSPTSTTTYTLTATNVTGTVTKSVTITVNPKAPVIDSFTVSPTTITQGQSATLSWILSGGAATSLSIDNSVGSVLGTTSKVVSPTSTTTYILTATNVSGTATKSITITVNQVAPIIDSFTATPSAINSGQSATLSWTLSGGAATTLSTDNSIGSALGKTSIVVKPTITTTYVLTASNSAGTVIQPVAVEVATNPQLTTVQYSPNAGSGGANTSVDGRSGKISNTAWADIRSGAGTHPDALAETDNLYLAAFSSGNLWNSLYRPFFLFDTSNLPAGAVITSATLKLYIISKTDDFAQSIILVSGTPAANNNIVNKDYAISNFGTTEYAARVASSALKTGEYYSMPLNEAGLAAIAKTGITKFGLRLSADADNAEPDWVANNQTNIQIQMADSASNKPVLEIAYTIGTNLKTDYQYDANGNLTSDGVFNYTYNYNNLLAAATNIASGATITYTYDPAGQRLTQTDGTTTTVYVSKYYNYTYLNSDKTKTPTNIVKHIFAGSQDIATIQGSGASAKVYYATTDSLNSSTVMTDSTGAIAETMDYYPFGEMRLDTKPAGSTLNEQRKYIGQEYDADTGLNYLNARYYNATLARFISQDPMFWSFDANWLADPQNQNAYAYARNNPITLSDPSGKYAELVFVATGPFGLGAHGYINIVPEQGANLSQYNINGGDGSHYTIGGYPSSWNPIKNQLQVIINESGNYNTFASQRLATIPLAVPKGQTTAQYDSNLLSSGYDLSQQSLGNYFGLGRPTSISANSGNAWTQTVINAGGTVPDMQTTYYSSVIPGVVNMPHFPYGSGRSIDTPWAVSSAIQTTGQAISYAGQVISRTASTVSQSALNGISATISRISSIIDSLKSK